MFMSLFASFDGLDFFATPTGAQELLASELRNHSYFARGNIWDAED